MQAPLTLWVEDQDTTGGFFESNFNTQGMSNDIYTWYNDSISSDTGIFKGFMVNSLLNPDDAGESIYPIISFIS